MQRLVLAALLVFQLCHHASSLSVVWNCAQQSYNGTECNALMIFNSSGGQTSTLVDLSAYALPWFMAADSERQLAYLVFDNGTILTTAFSGSPQTQSSAPLNGTSDLVDLIVDVNSGNLYALLEHNMHLSTRRTLELVQVNPTTGSTVSIALNSTNHAYFMSSSFDYADSRYFAVFASDDDWELITISVGAGNMTSVPVPYGLTAIAYDDAADSVYGLLSMAPIGENTLVTVDLVSANVSVVGKPFMNTNCGATLIHGGFDATQSQYVTLCCDTTDCTSQANVTVIDATSNAVVQSVSLAGLQAPASGLFVWNS